MRIEASPVMPCVPFEVAERGEQIVPCPLVSRGRPTYLSLPAPDEPLWLAVHTGVGPAKLLVNWAMAHGGSRLGGGQLPSTYVIETSANSTNGRDGEWRRELSIEGNAAGARAHVVEFDGQSWLRLTLLGESAGPAFPFSHLDLHDASDGTDDCWLALGDARLGALALGASQSEGEERWAELIHERYPGYFPALVDETRSSESPSSTLERLSDLLAIHSSVRRVAIAYSEASIQDIDADAAALEAMVSAVLHSGRLPVLARQPAIRGRAHDAVNAFNRCIAAVERRHGLVPGPDLAAWFDAHLDQLDGDGRPSIEGGRAIARLWADAVDVWYVPQ